MIKIIKLSDKFYGQEITTELCEPTCEAGIAIASIVSLTHKGNPVILVMELEDLNEIGISPVNVIMVKSLDKIDK